MITTEDTEDAKKNNNFIGLIVTADITNEITAGSKLTEKKVREKDQPGIHGC